MKYPDFPSNEPARLSALHALELLDTAHEDRFDRVTRIAQHHFQVPMALISLVDDNRQWFKSSQGLDAKETPRNISFCGHAILNEEIFYIPNALDDPRFADNPLVTGGPNLRFYAGAPLHAPMGERVGTLCILDSRVRDFSTEDLSVLRDLADIIEEQFGGNSPGAGLLRLGQLENRVHAIIETVVDGVVMIDRHGIIQTVNTATSRLFGYAAEEMVGQNVKMLMPEPDRRDHDGFLSNYLRTGEKKIIGIGREVLGLRKNGTLFPMDLSVGEMEVNGERVFTGITRDLSASKQAEIMLQTAKSDAEKANRAKSEFLSSMSHELRTPLNAVLGFAQIIENEVVPDHRQAVGYIIKSGKHLLNLINQILDFSRIETGDLQLVPEVGTVLHEISDCLQIVETLAHERDVTITTNLADLDVISVEVDRTRFKQILINLLTNAIKYNVSGGKVSFGHAMDVPGLVRFSVTDNGIGIVPDRRAQLFQPFNRLGVEESDVEGVGLGLVISKRIIEAMGGQIGFESTLGTGSTFWFTVPLNQSGVTVEPVGTPVERLSQMALEIPAPTNRSLILYVEDNPENLALMKAIVSRNPQLELVTATSGEAGLELARNVTPDIILLDIHIADIDGYTILDALRSDAQFVDIPILAVSAAALAVDIERGNAAGFQAYLTKPLDVQRVLETIDRFVDKRD